MTTRIQLRRGNASSWTSANPVLALGEAGIETNTEQWKVGDGVTAWANLAYMSASNVVSSYGNANVAAYLPTYSGNIGGSNIGVSGAVNAVGEITSFANLVTTGEVQATGNITGDYIFGNGSQLTGISSSYSNANVSTYLASGTNSANILTSAQLSATGNATAGNILTAGTVSAAGNVRGANFNTVGLVSATGNITGNYIFGNGSQLTGINASANTGNVTFDDINIIGTGNLHLQPDDNNSGAYLDVYLTTGPDIHVAGNGENLILGRDDGANVTVSAGGDVIIQAWDGAANTWTFGSDGTFTTPGVSGNITGANVISANTFITGNTELLSGIEGANTVGFYNADPTEFIFELGANPWSFNGNTGGTGFPTLSVQRGDATSGTITGQTLLFGDNTQEAIISTPDGTANGSNSSQRLVINPGAGADGTGGEGGDIYLWAGRGGDASGSGGDIKIRGGQGGANTNGGSGGDGGYIRMEAGDTASTGGYPGYIEITGGVSSTAQGGYVQILAGQGLTGGDANLTGGYASSTTGGNVNLAGGQSANGLGSYGNVNISSGASTWTFDNTGNINFPANTIINTPAGTNGNINFHPDGTGAVVIQGSAPILLNLKADQPDQLNRVEIDTFGTANFLGGAFTGTFSRGNLTAPAAVQANDRLASIKGKGFDGSLMSPPVGQITIDAFDNWEPGNTPSRISFFTTGYSSNSTPILNMQIDPTGNVSIFNGNINVGGGGYLFGNVVTGNAAAFIGIPGYTPLGSNIVAQFSANTNAYTQLNFQNISSGNVASGDFVITADNGDDATYFIDMGIASSTYDFPGFGVIGPNDGYLFVAGADQTGPSTGSSNLNLGSTDGNIRSWIGGGDVGNIITTVHAGGLEVAGNINLTGYIIGGEATVVTDGINSIALSLGAQMDVFGFPFSTTTRGQLTISDVTTPAEANGTWYYQSINTNAYQLYTDSTYSTLVDASGWSAYTGGGSVAITKQSPPANIVINSNGFLSTFANNGTLDLPGNLGVVGDIGTDGNLVVSGSTNISNVTINSYTSVPQLWFKGTLSAAQNVITTTDTVTIWDTNTDPQSWGNVTTGQITPNKAGWYEVISRVEFNTNAAANSQIQLNHQIAVNGAQQSISQMPSLNGNVPLTMMSTAMVELNGTTDFITTTCWSNVAGNAQQINGGNTSLLLVKWVSN